MKSIKILAISGFSLLIVAQTSAQKPEETEVWEPEPKVVTPSLNHAAPSDAITLFDGKNFSQWTDKDGGEVKWKLGDQAMTVVKGTGLIKTKQGFGSIQLHIEWRTPAVVIGESQGRGNSGIFLQETYEVQVLDSYNNRTYSNGQAASIYKQHIPLVNACRGPGEWQTYDIIYQAPNFTDDGTLDSPAYVTVLHNGVLVQNHVELTGPTLYIGTPEYKAHDDKLPITLQDHSNPVSYRNIWVREL
ncbi:MAG: 3-keto-disaccharide hydrolase [Cyclobacteriaceae bacterium]